MRPVDLLLQYVCASCLLLVPGLAQFDRTCAADTRQRDGVCGSRLDEMLEVLCSGFFNSRMWKRSNVGDTSHLPQLPGQLRSDIKRNVKRVTDMKQLELSKLKDLGLSKIDAHSFLGKRSGHYMQNIICECCIYQCSIDELQGYCGGDWWLKKRSSSPGRLPPKPTKTLDPYLSSYTLNDQQVK